jgi:cytochrome P450 family 3 subfamily A
MFPTINECTDLFINILKERSDPSTELEIYEPFQGLTLDVISRCALALQLDCQRNVQVSLTWLWLNTINTFHSKPSLCLK